MKFNCNKKVEDWHPYFALIPHNIGDGDYRWLETIERRQCWGSSWGVIYCWWEYRAQSKQPEKETQ